MNLKQFRCFDVYWIKKQTFDTSIYAILGYPQSEVKLLSKSALFLTTGRVPYAVCLVSNYGQSFLCSLPGLQLQSLLSSGAGFNFGQCLLCSSFVLNIIS